MGDFSPEYGELDHAFRPVCDIKRALAVTDLTARCGKQPDLVIYGTNSGDLSGTPSIRGYCRSWSDQRLARASTLAM